MSELLPRVDRPRLVPDQPRVVIRRGWRIGLPLGVAHLLATGVLHATVLPDADALGAAGDTALERWLLGGAAVAAVTTWLWMLGALRVEPGSNRWVPRRRYSGVPPVPDPQLGCLPVVLAVLAIGLVTVLELLAVVRSGEAVLLAVSTLIAQLAGAIAAAALPLVLITPVIALVAGLGRRWPTSDGDAATGPALVASGVASLAGLGVVAGLALLLGADIRLGGPLALVSATLTLVGVVSRIVLVRRARPARSG